MKPGDKVCYVTDYKPPENGVVKSISDTEHVFVVYNCDNDWDNYMNYTVARTRVSDLKQGWKL